MKLYTTKTYVVTTNNKLMDSGNNITPPVRHILEAIHPDVEAGKKSMIKKLEAYCESYPEVPVFKNLLSSIYSQRGDFQKTLEVNDWLIKEHPDYFYGKINRALQYLDQDQPEKVPDILGEGLDIGLLYPERTEFHLEEVFGFNEICVRYFILFAVKPTSLQLVGCKAVHVIRTFSPVVSGDFLPIEHTKYIPPEFFLQAVFGYYPATSGTRRNRSE